VSSSIRKAIALIAAALGMFLCALDLTVNVALPAITKYFGTDMTTVQWIIILYVGSTTALQLVLGRLADTHGLKRAYVLGLGIHTLAVAGIGVATDIELVLGLRVVQAISYGLILSTTPALVSTIFAAHERGRALGLMTAVATIGMITATLGGGLLVDAFGWHSIFLARVPIGVAALLLAVFVLPEDHLPPDPQPLDLAGAAMLVIAIGSLVLFFNVGGRLGWAHPGVMALLIGSLCSAWGFARFERRASAPTVHLDVLTPEVVRALAAAFLMSLATFINLFILPFFVSDVVGASPTTLGILLMLPPAVSAGAAPLAGWLSDRHAPRLVATAALAWLAVTMASFALLNSDATVFEVGVRLALFGFGLGAFQASNANSVMGSVPEHRLGSGGAVLALANGLGVVTSVGLMTALFNALKVANLDAPSDNQAFVQAFTQTYLIAAGLLTIATIVSASRTNRPKRAGV
jgi:MFS family permease